MTVGHFKAQDSEFEFFVSEMFTFIKGIDRGGGIKVDRHNKLGFIWQAWNKERQ